MSIQDKTYDGLTVFSNNDPKVNRSGLPMDIKKVLDGFRSGKASGDDQLSVETLGRILCTEQYA